MSGICGGQEPLLNLTALWAADNPNLPRCFSRSVLTIVPAIILAVNWVQALAQLRTTLGRGRSSSTHRRPRSGRTPVTAATHRGRPGGSHRSCPRTTGGRSPRP